MSGLFDTFTIAKRGLNVAQGAINTTSHNISNANTEGYSRQRAVAETTKPFGGMSKFDTCSVGQVGTGAEITAIQRVRDSFIDYQVRSETGTSSYYTSISDALSKVEDIFGEPSDTGIQELIGKFFNSFQEVSKSPDKSDVKTVAIKNASALADAINYAYNQLKKTNQDNQSTLENNVTDVNSYLDQINALNKQIREVSAVGETPNDLMDKRDNLLDKLSSKFGIQIDKDSFETINVSSTEYPDSTLIKSDPNDINYNRFSYVKNATVEADSTTNDYKITVEYYPLGDEKSATKSFELHGDKSSLEEIKDSLLRNRILIADKDGNAIIKTPATLATSTMPGGATAKLTVAKNDVDVNTKITSTGDLTINIGSSAINIDASGAVTSNTSGYSVTKNSDGTMYIKLDSDVTIEVEKDGSITAQAENVKETSKVDLEKTIFQTYKYDSRTDEAGNTINNVDNNHVKGEIAGNESVQSTIQAYMDNLDRLAAGLAYTVNAIQTGSIDGSTVSQGLQNNLIFTNSGTTAYQLTASDITKLQSELDNTTTPPSTDRANELKMLIKSGAGSPAYMKADGKTITISADVGITASTIKINGDLLKDPTLLNCNTTSTSGEGDGKRANAIANINSLKLNLGNISSTADLTTMTRKQFLEGIGIDDSSGAATGFSDTTCLNLSAGTTGSTIDSYYKAIINNLGTASQEATRETTSHETLLANLQDQRNSVSGVSLDEEMTNLIQFQHAYQANAKVISTVDELLDVVINGLKK